MQSHAVGEKLLKGTPVGVRVEGVHVVLTIGKANVILDYMTALRLSTFLRHGGRKAKAAAGGGPVFTPYANLTPENAEELEASMSVDRKVIAARS